MVNLATAETNGPRAITVGYCKFKQTVALITATVWMYLCWGRLIGFRYVATVLESMLISLPNHKKGSDIIHME